MGAGIWSKQGKSLVKVKLQMKLEKVIFQRLKVIKLKHRLETRIILKLNKAVMEAITL